MPRRAAASRCGARYRGERLGRPHVGLHGAGRQPGGARRCRRGAGRFHLRGAAVCARHGRKPRRRLRREGDARRAQGRAAQAARCGRARRRGRSSRSSAATARRASSITSTSTTSGPTDERGRGSLDSHTPPRESATFDEHAIAEIHRAAATGIYDIRGFGAKRKLPHFDDLLFLGASISRYPLEGYREKCATDVTLGTRHAKKPITLKIPITIAGMSFGSLSARPRRRSDAAPRSPAPRRRPATAA